MEDKFQHFGSLLDSPATDGFDVTPDDDADLQFVTRFLYIGGAGDVSLVTKGGSTLTFTGLSAGSILTIRASRVRATGTTATNIIALY